MKKIIIAVLALFSLGIAEAQIQMKDTSAERSRVVCYGALGWNNLYITPIMGKDYYRISLLSTNRFDDNLTIYLGGKDEAIKTLSQFLDNFTPDGRWECKDFHDVPFTAYGDNPMEKRYMIVQGGYAGVGYLRLMDIKKFLKYLQKQ